MSQVEISNHELTSTLQALSQLSGLTDGALKLKIAQLSRAVLSASTTIEAPLLTKEDLEAIAKSPAPPSAIAFLLPFVDVGAFE